MKRYVLIFALIGNFAFAQHKMPYQIYDKNGRKPRMIKC